MTEPTASEVVASIGAKPACPHCSLTDVSFERTCHNSACSAYANAETVYEGWSTPPATDAGEVREKVARIIDASAFNYRDYYLNGSTSWCVAQREWKDALAKADAILALLSPADIAQVAPGVREGVEKACAAFEEAILDGYRGPEHEDHQCEHGNTSDDDCIACYDNALYARIAAIRALPSPSQAVGEG